MDQPTAKIRRRDLNVLVRASRTGVAPAVPILRVVPETTLPVRPLPMPDQPVPINALTVVLAFVVAMGVGFVATVPFW